MAAKGVSYKRVPWEAVHVKQPEPKLRTVPPARGLDLTEEQEAWIDRLRHCESRGDDSAVNEVDRDGTSSYYAYQFKPGTFRAFGEAYGVLPRGLTRAELMEALKRTDLQRAIVEHMIGDPSVRWGQQFPDCVRIHIGMPPGAASDR